MIVITIICIIAVFIISVLAIVFALNEFCERYTHGGIKMWLLQTGFCSAIVVVVACTLICIYSLIRYWTCILF